MNAYEKRDSNLRRLGYSSYAAYLAGGRWRVIRRKVLKRAKGICEVCGKQPPTQVHHRSYGLGALLGKRLDFLVACCRPCHKQAEFEDTRKTRPGEANSRMNAAAKAAGKTLYGLCAQCRKNPTRPGRTLCGKCAKLLVKV